MLAHQFAEHAARTDLEEQPSGFGSEQPNALREPHRFAQVPPPVGRVRRLFGLDPVAGHARHERQLRRVQPIAVAELPEIIDESDGPEASDPALTRKLQAAVATLPPVPRAVMLLRYQEDLDLADIADVLEIPINTVKSHLRRSLHAMRMHLQDAQLRALHD